MEPWLSEHLLKTVNNSKTRNTLWKYFGLTTRAELLGASSLEDKLNYIIQAIEKTSEPNLTIAPQFSDDPLEKEKKVIEYAELVAEKVGAKFIVARIESGKVVLNLGRYILYSTFRQQIKKFGKGEGVEVVIEEGQGERS